MEFKKSKILVSPEILKYKTDGDYTGPITVDFTSVTDKLENGEKIVRAGSPMASDGTVSNDGQAIGILLTDVAESRPMGTIVKHGAINTKVAENHAGLSYGSDVKDALKLIIFE